MRKPALVTLAASSALLLTPAAASASGLLGGLLGTTTTTTTTITQQTLNTLTTQVSVGTLLPSSSLTTPVTQLVDAGVSPDPSLLTTVVNTVNTLVPTGQTPTGGQLTDVVTTLLQAGTDPTQIPTILGSLLPAVGSTAPSSDLITGTVDQLLTLTVPTSGTPIDNLTGLLGTLTGGATPTGSLLSPVADLLDAVASNTALPTDARTALSGLSSQIRAAGTQPLSTDLLGQLGSILTGLGSNPALPANIGNLFGSLGSLLGGSGRPSTTPPATTAPGTTPTPYSGAPGSVRLPSLWSMRATVVKVALNRTRSSARALVSCPTVAVLGCDVTVVPTSGGRTAGSAQHAVMVPGTFQTLSMKLSTATARKVRKHGGRVTVKATTKLVGRTFSTSRSTTVRVARRVKHR